MSLNSAVGFCDHLNLSHIVIDDNLVSKNHAISKYKISSCK